MNKDDYYNKKLALLKAESERLQSAVLELELNPIVQEYITLKQLLEWNLEELRKTKKFKDELPFEPLFIDRV